jgi:hypothetical protein
MTRGKPRAKGSVVPPDGKGSYRPPQTRGTQAEADRLRAVLMDIVMKHRAGTQPYRGRDAESERWGRQAASGGVARMPEGYRNALLSILGR